MREDKELESNITVFVDGKLTDDKCPENNTEFCVCSGKLSFEYGFTPYGLGSHMMCVECSNVYNFCEDKG